MNSVFISHIYDVSNFTPEKRGLWSWDYEDRLSCHFDAPSAV